jgi:hypothetical protein
MEPAKRLRIHDMELDEQAQREVQEEQYCSGLEDHSSKGHQESIPSGDVALTFWFHDPGRRRYSPATEAGAGMLRCTLVVSRL